MERTRARPRPPHYYEIAPTDHTLAKKIYSTSQREGSANAEQAVLGKVWSRAFRTYIVQLWHPPSLE